MMKLSDIKGDRAIDVVADLIDPVCNIAQDPATKDLMTVKEVPEGANVYELAVQRLRKHVPALIKAHKNDLVAIFSALEGVPQEEYKESLSFAKLLSDVVVLLNDREFLQFFMSAAQGVQNTFGAAQENTTEASK